MFPIKHFENVKDVSNKIVDGYLQEGGRRKKMSKAEKILLLEFGLFLDVKIQSIVSKLLSLVEAS